MPNVPHSFVIIFVISTNKSETVLPVEKILGALFRTLCQAAMSSDIVALLRAKGFV
jgi:hypothetical protein